MAESTSKNKALSKRPDYLLIFSTEPPQLMVKLMASSISSPISQFSSSSVCTKSASSPLYVYTVSYPRTIKGSIFTWVSPLGLRTFSPWSGLKHLGVSIRTKSISSERKRKCKGMVVYASLFGVGAPEALVIGVVALLVFGPKGLAEVARNLGKTLRAFQPTIRELQEVSREFKSTLEREIGLDDIPSSTENTYSSNRPINSSMPSSLSSPEAPRPVINTDVTLGLDKAYTTEEYLKITENQLEASSSQQNVQTNLKTDAQIEPQTQSQGTVQEKATEIPPAQKPES